MCGIFGYVGPRTNSAEIVLDGLKALEYRGYDSWGVAVANSHINVKKKVGKIGDATVSEMPEGRVAFGHTRWATHGGVTQTNAHPHLDCSGSIAVIHNGIVENYESIKQKLLHSGHHFVSETDTEVIAHLLEDYRKDFSFEKAFQKTFQKLEGLNAVIAVDNSSPLLMAARNGSPLVIGFGVEKNFLASDSAALLPHTKRVYYLEDDDIASISDTNVTVYNVHSSVKREVKPQTLTWSVLQTNKGTFPHFMLKEIHEQPKIIADIAANGLSQATKLAGIIKKSYGTYLVGCGTASYAAIAGSYLFSKIAKRHINWAVGSEFGYHEDFITKRSLVIALSQSGETMDILESVKKAKARGASIAALVNVLGSTLYRISDYKILLGAGPEKAVASTKAFTAKIAHLILLVYSLASEAKKGQATLRACVRSMQEVLSQTSIRSIQMLADRLKDMQHIYVIGRGLSYPASLEAALKIKEISYIHAEGFAAGELKHGVLALITKGTPCIVFLPNDETYSANLAGAMEMKARGGRIIGVSFKPHDVFDDYVSVGDAKEATIIPNVVFAQLLAYYLSVGKGLDPDMPRNLAKSVTVK